MAPSDLHPPCGQGMPALTQASKASTNFSCESGGGLRSAPGAQAQRTRGSAFMCSMTSSPLRLPPFRSGSFICSQILLPRPAFPQHGHRCKVPGRYARNETISRVRRLMTRLALLRGRAVAVLPADDQRLMKDLQIRLPGRLVLMAIDASRMHDDAGDGIEQRRSRRRRGFAAAAGCDGYEDDERQKAGAVTAVPGSPIPPGFSKLRTRCTSIAGASLIRSVRTSWKLDCCTRPFSIVTSPHKAPLIPKMIPPSICALTVSGFTTVPQSTAQTIRCTRISPALLAASCPAFTCARVAPASLPRRPRNA